MGYICREFKRLCGLRRTFSPIPPPRARAQGGLRSVGAPPMPVLYQGTTGSSSSAQVDAPVLVPVLVPSGPWILDHALVLDLALVLVLGLDLGLGFGLVLGLGIGLVLGLGIGLVLGLVDQHGYPCEGHGQEGHEGQEGQEGHGQGHGKRQG